MVHSPHRNHKNSIWKWSEFHLKILQSPINKKKVRYLKKYTFLHSKPFHKIVLEWTIYPIETKKIELGVVWISPKNWLSYRKSLISAISQKIHIFAQHTFQQKSLRMIHLPHKNHKNLIWKQFEFQLKILLSLIK